ncbi:MAG: EAL domain-containing protein [Gammaproteobacteria bacterium]|nr:EAL domain-containing protein [Gammaproteobacteria bacterium]
MMSFQDNIQLSDFVFEHTSESIMITDANNKIILINSAMEKLTGYTRAELYGKNPSILSSGKQTKVFYQTMWNTLLATNKWKGEIWNKTKYGDIYPEELSLNVVRDSHHKVSHFVSIFRDISQWKKNEQQLAFYASRESLTGLFNRRYFIEHVEQQVAENRDHQPLSIIVINLDYFKAVNDIYGHEIGDSLLCKVANRLSKLLSKDHILSRHGNDEFTLLLSNTTIKQTKIIAKKIKESFQPLFTLEELTLNVTASIGVATYPDAGLNAKLLLRHANHAMRTAKAISHNSIAFYDNKLQQKYQEKLTLKEQLKQAIRNNELIVYYQPIVDIQANKIVKFESLVRWPNGQGGYTSPALFIPIAEEFGLIHLIGQFVLEQACADLKMLHQQGYHDICFSINRSISEFFHNEQAQQSISETIKKLGVPLQSIIIEITESTAMSEQHHAKHALAQLKKDGIKIALDDFCTGFSSLNYLIEYEIDIIKIDRSFVQALEHDKNSQILTATVLNLARQLNLEVIAEGVENEQQLEFFKRHHCQFVQGFYFSPAIAINDCLNMLRKQQKVS